MQSETRETLPKNGSKLVIQPRMAAPPPEAAVPVEDGSDTKLKLLGDEEEVSKSVPAQRTPPLEFTTAQLAAVRSSFAHGRRDAAELLILHVKLKTDGASEAAALEALEERMIKLASGDQNRLNSMPELYRAALGGLAAISIARKLNEKPPALEASTSNG